MDFPLFPPAKSQTYLSEGKAQSFVCSWPSCSLLFKYPKDVTPDKSLLKTSLFPSELLPLQKGKFHSSCLHPNSPLTGQQSLAFPICQTLNHLSKEVPGSYLALSSSFCSSDMSFLLCSILLWSAKLTPPPFPLPLAALTLYTRAWASQVLETPQNLETATAQMHSTCHSWWNSDLVLQSNSNKVEGNRALPIKINPPCLCLSWETGQMLDKGCRRWEGRLSVLYLRVIFFS